MELHQQYQVVARVIDLLRRQDGQPHSLEMLAEHAGMSATHFQKVFSAWAGISPKEFSRHLVLDRARLMLRTDTKSLFDTALDVGLSGSGRLHDLFITMESMTPAEYRNGGDGLLIRYDQISTPFGFMTAGQSQRGICHLSFLEGEISPLDALQAMFPNASFTRTRTQEMTMLESLFLNMLKKKASLHLHLHGTPFQMKIWELLLSVPEGRLTTYSELAARAGVDGGARAVGNAVGANPIAWLIPCHRVIRTDGGLGGYMWGETRKQLMLAREGMSFT